MASENEILEEIVKIKEFKKELESKNRSECITYGVELLMNKIGKYERQTILYFLTESLGISQETALKMYNEIKWYKALKSHELSMIKS